MLSIFLILSQQLYHISILPIVLKAPTEKLHECDKMVVTMHRAILADYFITLFNILNPIIFIITNTSEHKTLPRELQNHAKKYPLVTNNNISVAAKQYILAST
jgi:hypothetical protein